MKRFIGHSAAFLLVALSALTLMYVLIPKNEIHYLTALSPKQERIMSTASPKLVIVGGSNTAFGIHSDILADSLGMEVVNMGLHAGVGLRFMLYTAKDYLYEGDILLVLPEYSHFFNDIYNGKNELYSAQYYTDYELLRYCSPLQIAYSFAYLPVAVFKNIFSFYYASVGYRGDGCNEYGDYVYHYKQEDVRPIPIPVMAPPNWNKSSFEDFISVLEGLRAKGVRCVVSPPSLFEGAYESQKAMLHILDEELSKTDYAFVVSPEEHFFPDSSMFDTLYHLNFTGGKQYTHKLLEEIR